MQTNKGLIFWHHGAGTVAEYKLIAYIFNNNLTPDLNKTFARVMENLQWLPGIKIVSPISGAEVYLIFVIEIQGFILMLLVCYHGNK